MPHPTHVAAPPGEIFWRYEVPENRSAKMLLLTIGGICVLGQWQGRLGEQFMAWSPMPKRNRDAERRLFPKEKK
jgi:hypothetical protein